MSKDSVIVPLKQGNKKKNVFDTDNMGFTWEETSQGLNWKIRVLQRVHVSTHLKNSEIQVHSVTLGYKCSSVVSKSLCVMLYVKRLHPRTKQ